MLFLGVDAGGSKTVAALADAAGQVVALAEAGRGNFQHSTIEAARNEVQRSIELAAAQAAIDANQISSAYFG
ncbi:MAG TPA: ATPase, partial [Firmicutes bacterium]|nr:ATPase [Bacillota bacterium]